LDGRLNPDLFPAGFLGSSKRFRAVGGWVFITSLAGAARFGNHAPWETTKMKKITRRAPLGTASAACAAAILGKPVEAAAEFEFKPGVNTPGSHPLTNAFPRRLGKWLPAHPADWPLRSASLAAIRKCCHR
jgi:hypothetical protein